MGQRRWRMFFHPIALCDLTLKLNHYQHVHQSRDRMGVNRIADRTERHVRLKFVRDVLGPLLRRLSFQFVIYIDHGRDETVGEAHDVALPQP